MAATILPPPAPQPPVAPATAAIEAVRFSSSASPGTDPYSLLEEYFEWVVARVPSAREGLESAKNALLEERHDLVGISDLPMMIGGGWAYS